MVFLLVVLSVPAIGLLFLQNKQVQTSVSGYLTERLAEELGVSITLSSVRYNFFKRLHVYDLMIGDREGDTLIYSETTSLRFRKFRPDKKEIHIHRITTMNSYLNLRVDETMENNMEFFIEHFRRDIPPEEKVELTIDIIETEGTRFRYRNVNTKPTDYGINFSDLDIREINARTDGFLFRQDTTSMHIIAGSGFDHSGFSFDDLSFFLSVGKQFMTFSNGEIQSGNTVARVPLVDFKFNHYKNFRHIYDSVDIQIISRESLLEMEKVAYFFPQLRRLGGSVVLDGMLSGTFGELSGRDIRIRSGSETLLGMNMRLSGLPHTEDLVMQFNVDQFITHLADISRLTSGYPLGPLHDTILASRAGVIRYKGNFNGTIRDFIADGRLICGLGNLNFDLGMQPDTTGGLKFRGMLNAEDFLLGNLLDQEERLGAITLALQLEGDYADNTFSAIVDGGINSLGLYGYDYRNIDIDGRLSNRTFAGSFSIRDPNIDMNFNGLVDFEKEIPRMKFSADVAKLRPYYLGLRDDDPEYFASFLLETDLDGIQLDRMNGEVRLVNSLFRRTGKQVQLYDLALVVGNSEDSSFLKLDSDLLDAELKGNYRLSQIPPAFRKMLNTHLGLFPSDTARDMLQQQFIYRVDMKNADPALGFFFPDLEISTSSSISGAFHPVDRHAEHIIEAHIPRLRYDGIELFNLGIRSGYDSTLLDMMVDADSIVLWDEYAFISPIFEGSTTNNQTATTLSWDNQLSPRYAGYLVTHGMLEGVPGKDLAYMMEISPSWIIYEEKELTVYRSGIEIRKNQFSVDSMLIKGAGQLLMADGSYHREQDQVFTVAVENIDLSAINAAVLKDFVNLDGRITGAASLRNEEGIPILTSRLQVDSLFVNRTLFGKTVLNAAWNETEEELNVEIVSADKGVKSLDASGIYAPSTSLLDFDLKLNSIALVTFYPYLESVFDEINGRADMDLTLDGSPRQPKINGYIHFDDAGFVVSQTKSAYSFTDRLRIYDNDLFLQDLKIRDAYGNRLNLKGNLTHNYFEDFRLNIDFDATNFNFLNTTRRDNETFYGTVFASADGSLTGPFDQLHLEVDARTERNTDLKLPLYNPEEVKQKDFITFISRESETEEEVVLSTTETSGLTLKMDLEITSGAGVQMIFDPNVGDIIDASGSGKLRVEIDEKNELSIFGDVVIEDGEYLFTLQNVINKRFQVNPGGSITWNGTPSDALIDLDAIYETKAATYNLSPQPDESMRKRIPVHCILSLEGELMNPLITPEIELPTAEPETRTLLQNSTGTDEELMKQFISLLVLNNFLSNEGLGGAVTGGINTGNVAGVTASELLSNQLSNWLSQISNDFDIGVNYRPGDEISSDEVEVALSTQILDDRVIISGNVDVGGEQVNATGSNATNIVGDFDLEVRVTDRISIKAYNRANDDFILRNAPYTQGVGIFYRNEFDQISDLFKRKKEHSGNRDNESTEQDMDEAVIRDE